LEHEQDTLSHTEEIKAALYKVTDLLNGENQSVVGSLNEALSSVEQISSYFPKAEEFAERLRSAFIDISDLSSETNVLKDDIEFNPERFTWVNDRINLIYSLQQKHRVGSIEELITKYGAFDAQLAMIDSFDEEIELLGQKKQKAYQSLLRMAGEITLLRKKSAETIENQLTDRMILLGVPNTRFQISFEQKPEPTSDGMDDVNFLFAANKNEQLKPVALTASGGEISRLMLCVKSMIAGYSALPTIIFDEIDSGVSGEIADKMAGIMQDLGSKMQVITITHLPQIAAKGRAHYYVYKEDTPERTLTHIRHLNDSERIDEIARLLSGSEKTQAAYNNAKALLKVL
jgi:DNA repair protein RecN (Recombination protein N)